VDELVTRQFSGFLLATDPLIELPRAFLTDVLPQLQDVSEIHTTLAVFRLAAEAGGVEQPVAEQAVRRDRAVRAALRVEGSPRDPDRRIQTGLDLATGRATLLRFSSESEAITHIWYYVNTPANQGLVSAMARGSVSPPPAVWSGATPPTIVPERPNVFRLYEQNIGMLTPLVADQLIDALERFPSDWIEDAIIEAVSYNKRSWRYIQRILEQWLTQGRAPAHSQDRTHEANRRRHEDHLDPDKYRDGRHLARARRS
jgi:DnaD/phage-associated family protein